jgi:hypothetical protein
MKRKLTTTMTKHPLEYYLALFLFLHNVTMLVITWLDLPGSRFYFKFYVVRVLILTVAALFARTRLGAVYIPVLSEMDEARYWRTVILLVLALKLVFLNQFVRLSPVAQLLDILIISTLAGGMLISLQMHMPEMEPARRRDNRKKYLLQKSGLSPQELEAIRDDLIREGRKQQRFPLSWIVLFVALSLFLGALLDSSAAAIVDFAAHTLGLTFRGILLP